MGYAMMHARCFGCGEVFAFNPRRVPSISIEGDRKPVCRDCVAFVNPQREMLGLPPIVPHPDAYEPIHESEL